MTYSDLFTTENGIFKNIFKINFPDEYLKLFGDIAPESLDLITQLLYGNKILISNITETNKNDYINTIIKIRMASWIKAENLLSLQYDVTKPFNIIDSQIGTVTTKNNDLKTNTDSKKTFNDVTFTDSERTTDNRESTKTESTNFQNTRSGTNGSINITNSIKKEIEFRQNVFTTEVIRNILDYITLKIY